MADSKFGYPILRLAPKLGIPSLACPILRLGRFQVWAQQISHVKSTPEEDELPLWMSIMKEDIDVLVTQLQQQMYIGFSKMMSEMVTLYHKKNNEVSER